MEDSMKDGMKKKNPLKHLLKKENKTDDAKLDEHSDDKKIRKFRPDVILVLSAEGDILSDNEEELSEFFGVERMQTTQVFDLLPEASTEELADSFQKALEGESSCHELTVWNKQHERYMNVVITFFPIPAMEETKNGVYITLHDDSPYMQVLESLVIKKHHFEYMQKLLHVGSFQYDVEAQKMISVHNLASIFGFSADDVFDSPEQLLPFIHREDRERCEPVILEAFKYGTSYTVTFRIYYGKTDDIRHVKAYLKTRWDNNQRAVLTGIIQDTTMWQTDEETGSKLKNQPYMLKEEKLLYEEIEKLTEKSATPFGVIIVGIDHFHCVSEELGVKRTEEVIRVVKERVIHFLPADTFIIPYQSGTLLFVLKQVKMKQLLSQIEKLLEKIAFPISVNEERDRVTITASAGISLYPEDCKDKYSLVTSAAFALEEAKKLGSNNYQCYRDCKETNLPASRQLKKELRDAWFNRDLHLRYVPNVSPKSGMIRGAEVVVSWDSGDKMGVTANQLLKLADLIGIRDSISYWVVEQACLQLSKWKIQNTPIRPLTLCIPAQSLVKQSFPSHVRDQVKKYQIPFRLLQVKLMSTWPPGKKTVFLQNIKQLQEMGIKISITNLGTSQVSLNHLLEIPFHTFVIQPELIKGLKNGGQKELSILSSLIYLARNMNVTLAAEGVSDSEALDFLIQKECSTVQGPIYSEAVGTRPFTKLLHKKIITPRITSAIDPGDERRKFFRFVFPSPVLAEMTISEVNNQKVELGKTPVLIDDIGIGGIRKLTSLELPVNSPMLYQFKVTLLQQDFYFYGELVWKKEVRKDIFQYGVKFITQEAEQDRLANIINRMTVLRKINKNIPGTTFIHQNPYTYLRKQRDTFD